MAASTRTLASTLLVLVLVGGCLVLILQTCGPDTGPSLGNPAPDPRPTARTPAGNSLPSIWPDPDPSPRPEPVLENPLSVPDPRPGASPEIGPEILDSMVTALLVDGHGTPLPFASVSVQTLSPPKTVLTRGPTWTDATGKFLFLRPEASNVLYVWCPDLQAATKRTWHPTRMERPVILRLQGKGLVGRLIDDGGRPPAWRGVNLRLCIVPPRRPEEPLEGPSLSSAAPVSLDRKTGHFLAVLKDDTDRDLTVSALGQTGEILLKRVPLVNRARQPIVVPVSDPRGFFGTLSLRILDAPEGTTHAVLEVVTGGKAERMTLSGTVGGEQKAGPFAPGPCLVRAVAGDRISAWLKVQVDPGACKGLGILAVKGKAALRVRPEGPDGRRLEGLRLGLVNDKGLRIRAGFRADIQGLLAEGLYPGRYRVVVLEKRPGLSAPTLWVDLEPGGLHEHYLRFGSR